MNKILPSRQVPAAFTLVELLATTAIILILAAALLPVAGKMISRGRDAACLQNLHQLYAGVRLYAGDNDNLVPMITTGSNGTKWHYYIRDYVQSGTTWSKIFSCPADKAPVNGFLTYDMNSNLENMRFGRIPGTTLLITEGSGVYNIKGDAASIATLYFNHLNNTAVNVLYVNGSAAPVVKSAMKNSTEDPALWKPPSS